MNSPLNPETTDRKPPTKPGPNLSSGLIFIILGLEDDTLYSVGDVTSRQIANPSNIEGYSVIYSRIRHFKDRHEMELEPDSKKTAGKQTRFWWYGKSWKEHLDKKDIDKALDEAGFASVDDFLASLGSEDDKGGLTKVPLSKNDAPAIVSSGEPDPKKQEQDETIQAISITRLAILSKSNQTWRMKGPLFVMVSTLLVILITIAVSWPEKTASRGVDNSTTSYTNLYLYRVHPGYTCDMDDWEGAQAGNEPYRTVAKVSQTDCMD